MIAPAIHATGTARTAFGGACPACCRTGSPVAQHFIGGFTVNSLLVDAGHRRGSQQGLALFGRGRTDAGGRRGDPDALDDAGRALGIQERDQGFAHSQLGDGFCGIKRGVGAHGLGRGAHGLLVARGEGAQRVLHAVAQLAQHALGHIQRILGDEVDAHALGADQAHHLLDLVQQRLGRVIEQQVRLVEEEDHLRLGLVAHLGQLLEEFREQPQQEGAIELGRVHQLVGHQDVDDAAPIRGGAHHVR